MKTTIEADLKIQQQAAAILAKERSRQAQQIRRMQQQQDDLQRAFEVQQNVIAELQNQLRALKWAYDDLNADYLAVERELLDSKPALPGWGQVSLVPSPQMELVRDDE